MPKIRVIVFGLPRLLGEIVNGIVLRRPHMEIVGQPQDWMELIEMVDRKEADVVVLGCEKEDLAVLGIRLLREYPLLRIVGVIDDGRQTSRYELWPRRQSLASTSPEALMEAIEALPDWTGYG